MPYTLVRGAKGNCSGGTIPRPAANAEDMRNLFLGSRALQQTRSLAYERFKGYEREDRNGATIKGGISGRASMGENLLEIEKSLRTIELRAMQLLRFTKAIKRGDFSFAAHTLRTPELTFRHPIKESANNWLEFHLGIAPVVGDIYSAVDILQSPIDNQWIKERAHTFPGKLSEYRYAGAYAIGLQQWFIDRINVQYTAQVAVSNPNLWLANQLGVLNPAVVAWQMIPLSFVLDWFVNVEQFLGTGSDLFGLTILKASTTSTWWGHYYEQWNTYGWFRNFNTMGMERELGVVTPNLTLRPLKATSWQRGLTAISLLVGGLKSLDQRNPRKERANKHFFEFDKNKRGVIEPRSYDWRDVRRDS